MRDKYLILCMAIIAFLSGCSLSVRATPTPEMSPVDVTYAFYRWYIGYPANPLVDKAYQSSPYLTGEWIAEIDETLDSFDKAAYDPILLAQDIPERFTVQETSTLEDRATVTLHLFWQGNDVPSERQVELVREEGSWKIAGVHLLDE